IRRSLDVRATATEQESEDLAELEPMLMDDHISDSCVQARFHPRAYCSKMLSRCVPDSPRNFLDRLCMSRPHGSDLWSSGLDHPGEQVGLGRLRWPPRPRGR